MSISKKELIIEAGVSGVKSIFGAVPFVGSALDEIVFDYWGRLKQNRLNRFTQEFSEYVKNMNLQNVDIEYIKSEQFIDVFREILSSVVKTNSEKKLAYYKQVLGKQIFKQNNINFVPTFLDIVDKIDDNEFLMLEYFYKITNDESVKEEHALNIKNGLHTVFGLNEDEYLYYKISLASKCLLQDVNNGTWDEINTPYLTTVKTTILGNKFIEYLSID